jgi:hypothetical protein
MNVLFIDEQYFKDITGASQFIDGIQIRPMIKVAQDTFIMDALGSTLYKRLLSGVDSDNLNSNEELLIESYISPALVWETMSLMTVTQSYQLFAKGVFQKSADNSVNPSKRDIDFIETYYKQIADTYKQRLIGYLKANYTLFQEYADPGCGWDVVRPASLGYECPIYLGDTKKETIVDTTVKEYSHLKKSKYTASYGQTTFSPSPSIDGKTILLASRANRLVEIVSHETSDTNELQVVGNVVTLPTGDIAQENEIFNFFYV